MRAAQYTVGDAECVVYFFGPGQGGTVEANIARWSGQFAAPDGKPAAAKVTKSNVHGLPVTRMDISVSGVNYFSRSTTTISPDDDNYKLADRSLVSLH